MKHFYLLPLLAFSTAQLHTADTLRIYWNLLNYSSTNEDGRTLLYEKIIKEINPHVVLLQEIADIKSSTKLHIALGEGWHGVDFIDGPDTDNQMFFQVSNETPFVYKGPFRHATPLRDIAEYRLELPKIGEIVLFSLHLKAGDTEADALLGLRKSKFLERG